MFGGTKYRRPKTGAIHPMAKLVLERHYSSVGLKLSNVRYHRDGAITIMGEDGPKFAKLLKVQLPFAVFHDGKTHELNKRFYHDFLTFFVPGK